jgi:hypothetical protein
MLLKDRALYDRIKDLPQWRQLQEFGRWSSEDEFLMVYLIQEEGFMYQPAPHEETVPDSLAGTMIRMGMDYMREHGIYLSC